jgi:lysophospholipase L1-like esterase
MRTRSILSCLLLLISAGSLRAANESNFTYLALGDSIAFGLDPTLFRPGLPAPTPSQFTGYPEIVADAEHLLQSKKEVNAACPGETSASFYIPGAPDNGCNTTNGPLGVPFKLFPGLHTNYSGTQLAFAISHLSTNKHINLVTLGIGGNDLLLVEAQCAANPSTFAACVQATLPGVLQSYAGNLAAILTAIRANYRGTLVLVNNYSSSADPLFIQAVAALDSVTKQVGTNFGAKFADAFTAFQIASALHNGDPCASGLLIHLSATTCDVHPSPLGRDLLAATVLFATRDDNQGSGENDGGSEDNRR